MDHIIIKFIWAVFSTYQGINVFLDLIFTLLQVQGFAVGGLSGGEAKSDFCRTVHQSTGLLPRDRPRYLMGVGFPIDLIVCVALGCDMFDCVYPTRTARFGQALVDWGLVSSAPLQPG